MECRQHVWKEMTVGVCYYPEHWDESLWADDLRRMRENGITVVRIAEFAWNFFEPEEGVFTFDFFDRFMALCEPAGIQVIFCTPTATPPAWLTEKYPEVLNADKNGVLYRHGLRRHYNYNSPVYLEKCAIITRKLAEHYGHHPAIIGWQIDNELNCHVNTYYSEADTVAFRTYLQNRYGTLDALNQAWGTVFWNQTYTDWAQIYVPRNTPTDSYSPQMLLDYDRFLSESAIRFCGLQAEILHAHIGENVFVSTNGVFAHIDNHKMVREHLNTYAYDSYPNFALELSRKGQMNGLRDRWWSKNLAEARSACPHFCIMEQQSGAGCWYNGYAGPSPRPGQMLLWALQSVAHGADFVSFFRWRTCTFGTEIYWHGILNYDNRDTRRLQEARQFADRMEKLQPFCGAEFVAEYALVKDYDNVYDAEIDQWHRLVSQPSEDAIFETSERIHTPCDLVYLRDDMPLSQLTRYKALFMPHAFIMTQARADLLEAYVRQGGTLIVGCRTGYKDIHGRCVMMPQPGYMQKLTATDVSEYTFASPAEEEPYAIWNGEKLDAPVFNDVLTPLEGTKVLARYATSYYAGEAALTENRLGHGKVWHLGTTFTVATVTRMLTELGLARPFVKWVQAPDGVETVMRKKDGKGCLFALNYQAQPQTVTLPRSLVSVFSGETHQGEVVLPPFGVEVWQIPEA